MPTLGRKINEYELTFMIYPQIEDEESFERYLGAYSLESDSIQGSF